MSENSNDILTERIIGLCFEIHNKLGPGFPEKIYHNALIVLLKKHKVKFETEKQFSVEFESVKVGEFRCDLIIEEELILELKAVEGNMPKLFSDKMIAYLKAADMLRGLLVNFGNASCVVKRISN
jgi:GxxExxY protein